MTHSTASMSFAVQHSDNSVRTAQMMQMGKESFQISIQTTCSIIKILADLL